MSQYTNELHIGYRKAVSSFLDAYPDRTLLSRSKDIDSFFRVCAIALWNGFGVDIPTCTNAINEIYCKETERRVYAETEIKAAYSEISDKKVNIKIPSFFCDIVDYDASHNTNFSRRFAVGMQVILLTFTLIDQEVSFDEARMISKFYQTLTDYCDEKKVVFYKNDVDPFSFVEKTNNNKTKPASVKTEKRQITDNKDCFEELNNLIGLKNVKAEINEIANFAKVQKMRKEKNLPLSPMSYHLVFTGNPGTGKTTVARLVAKIYKNLGIISKGQLVEADSSDLVAGYVGQTAIKTGELVKKAVGGVLFIDEAYTITENEQGYGQEAVDTLLKLMEDYRDDLVVIVAGYPELMKKFINSNPGLKSRFNRYIQFEDYNNEELYDIFNLLCNKNKYVISENAKPEIKKYLEHMRDANGKDFGNGRDVRNYFESVISKQATRLSEAENITDEDLSLITYDDVKWNHNSDENDLDSILSDINSLIGLSAVKNEISELVSLVKMQQNRKSQGLAVPNISLHLVFTGSPGTGKTTVARYIAKVYKALGLLSKGQLVETDRSGLVAGYVGQTAIKVNEMVEKAIGGVLFIDEAYTLVSKNDDFGQEAIDTLLKSMEDYRENLVVIVAGYDEWMDKFINSNPGLKSRFNRYIHFENYTSDEMLAIFKMLCIKNQYTLKDNASEILKTFFESVSSEEIGNGRGVRNIFEKAVTAQAKRLSLCDADSEKIAEFSTEDIQFAIKNIRG